MRKALKFAGIALAAVVVLLLIIPLIINADSFRPQVQSSLSNALARQVKIGKLSLSIFSGSVSADELSIADDPKFSSEPFVQAKSIRIGVELLPLIFSKKLNITSLVLKEPQIKLLKGRRAPGISRRWAERKKRRLQLLPRMLRHNSRCGP